MEQLHRYYEELDDWLRPERVLIIYGPRRAGKTTLLKKYLSRTGYSYKLDSGDNARLHQIFASQEFDSIKEYVGKYELIAIDEAQLIPNIGMGLKIIVDQVPNIRVIATGSSAFHLSQSVGEPLTGRKRTIILYPLAQRELLHHMTPAELRESMKEYLIFGSYPEVLTLKARVEKIEYLNEIVDSYLLRDILSLERLKGADLLLSLLRLLALQVGQLVSHHELATQIGINTKTVGRYIDLLEKAFVIVRIRGYTTNPRKSIAKKCKYYFLDNGIRNAIINNYNSVEKRQDIGALWENFIMIERIKRASFRRDYANRYFWRTYSGQEVDLVEEKDGQLWGFETKWSNHKTVRPPNGWVEQFPDASYELINPKNYLDHIL